MRSQFDDLTAYNEGREVLLAFNSDVGEALTSVDNIAQALIRQCLHFIAAASLHQHIDGDVTGRIREMLIPTDDEGFILAKAAKIIRWDILGIVNTVNLREDSLQNASYQGI